MRNKISFSSLIFEELPQLNIVLITGLLFILALALNSKGMKYIPLIAEIYLFIQLT